MPLQLPLLVVSVLPSWAVPEIVGGDWFTGGACGAAPPVSASPATAASRSSAPTAASPSTFMFFRMSFLSSNACFALLLSTLRSGHGRNRHSERMFTRASA